MIRKIALIFSLIVLPAAVLPTAALAQENTPSPMAGGVFKFGVSLNPDGYPDGGFEKNGAVGVEYEVNFKRDRLWLSGFGIGLRKEYLGNAEQGHLLQVKTFRYFRLPWVYLKPGVGVEYGVPTSAFERTEHHSKDPLAYTHRALIRNTDLPVGAGQTVGGIIYPFVELPVVRKVGPFRFEGGVRFLIANFSEDRFEVHSPMDITSTTKTSRRPAPYLFFNIGISP